MRRSHLLDITKFLLLLGGLTWLVSRGAERVGYNWQWYRVPKYFLTLEKGEFIAGPLLAGLRVTAKITLLSLCLALSFGLVAALLRLSRSFMGRVVARGYLELIRNTPLLVQLFFIYFVLSPLLDISGFTSAVLGLSLFEGAYASEIFRSGIVSIHRGQWEAAHSLGLGTFHTYRSVILPQAIRRILPPLAGQVISLVKDSALVSAIAIYDLTMQGQAIIAETYLALEIWFAVAAVYLLITVTLSTGITTLENHLKIES